jgi:hypothetical protein
MAPALRNTLWIALVITAGSLGLLAGYRAGANMMGDVVVGQMATNHLERQINTAHQALDVLDEASAEQAVVRSEAMLFDALGNIELSTANGHRLECDARTTETLASARAYLASHPEFAEKAERSMAGKGAMQCP